MKKIFKIISVTVLSIILISCGKSDKKVLNVYTGLEEEYLVKYIEIFKKDFPDIELNIVRDSQGAISAKVLAEKENPQADVLWGLAGVNLIELDKQSMLNEIDFINLNNFKEIFIDKKNSNPHWIGMDAWTSAIIVNKIELEKKNLETPNSYRDLLKPEYESEIVMPNPASSGTGFLTVLGWINIFGENEAWEYMDELNKNMKMYVHSGSAPVRMTMQGENLMGIGMDSESLRLGRNNDAVKTIFPSEGYGWDMEGVALIKKDSIKPEAKQFIEWALSKKMMEEYSNNIGILAHKEVKTKLTGYTDDFEEKLAKADFYWAAENRERILKEWERRYGKGEN